VKTKDCEDGRLFESLFNQAGVPLCVLKADPPVYTILAMNRQFRQTSNTATDNAIGKSAFEIYKPYDAASDRQYTLLKAGLEEAISEKRRVKLPVLYFETRIEGDSLSSWWQIEIDPVLADDQSVSHLLCNTSNVTEKEQLRREARIARERELELQEELRAANEELTAANEELITTIGELHESQQQLHNLNTELEHRVSSRTHALAASEKKLQIMLDSLPQIAWTTRPNGEIDFFNQRWYDYTGLSFDESKASGWQQIIHPDDLQYNMGIYQSILLSQKAGEFEIRERGYDGVYRWHLVRLRPLFQPTGDIDHWIGTATEIDTLKKLQEQKDDFISIASHELKTPLTSLKASLQLLDRMKDNPSGEKFRKLVDQANRGMYKISTLVDDLLDMNRMRETNLSLNKKPFILSQLIGGCCNHISLVSDHNLAISGNKTLQVYADERAIDQVIVNLVNNAIKYAPDSKDIRINIEQKGNMAKVSVKDDGPGIPKDKLPLIFNRYYRAGAITQKSPGLGLGLHICSEIIKKHGGEISVESELGRGSTFWFTLPLV
jgi:PAS domain S-box-containing protein